MDMILPAIKHMIPKGEYLSDTIGILFKIIKNKDSNIDLNNILPKFFLIDS